VIINKCIFIATSKKYIILYVRSAEGSLPAPFRFFFFDSYRTILNIKKGWLLNRKWIIFLKGKGFHVYLFQMDRRVPARGLNSLHFETVLRGSNSGYLLVFT
jgi:hypothetical protein